METTLIFAAILIAIVGIMVTAIMCVHKKRTYNKAGVSRRANSKITKIAIIMMNFDTKSPRDDIKVRLVIKYIVRGYEVLLAHDDDVVSSKTKCGQSYGKWRSHILSLVTTYGYVTSIRDAWIEIEIPGNGSTISTVKIYAHISLGRLAKIEREDAYGKWYYKCRKSKYLWWSTGSLIELDKELRSGDKYRQIKPQR